MTRGLQESRYELARRQLIALGKARDHVVHCQEGELWLTQEGPRDIILGPGEEYAIEGQADLVISACKDSRFLVRHPEKCTRACRVQHSGAEWTLASLLRWRQPALAGWPAVRLR